MINDRLRELRESLKINKNQFAVMLGVPNVYITRYEKGDTVPGTKFYEVLKNKMPSVNIDWLVNGKGEMYDNEDSRAHKMRSKVRLLPVYSNIPCGDVSNIFGNIDTVEMLEVSGVSNLNAPIILRVKGESNYPYIKDKDLIIAHPVDEPKDGDIIATNFKASAESLNANIKVYQPVDQFKFLLKPLNTHFHTTVHRYSEVYSFYKCKKLIRDLY
jgi:transcriptional regulator with XRE-family HTH domain